MTKSNNSTKGDNIALAPMLDFLNHTTEAKVIGKQVENIQTLIAI